ncbi:hypothetical protein QUC31_008764 [Theobroma cacao]|uniref:Plant invertase/pectin methylesterase inhibitor superfamily protein, putative n=1 Tax=Theobroma cacao TaxID=3641 RepID=A0A061G4D2_THECC|nr:Plant invertase/pectin methylesterase inhibitor superfamily protein, putative [Theobroma cacao]
MAAGSYFSVAALAILIQLTINLNLCLAAAPIHPSGRNTRFIRTSCRATLYPNLCFTTFSRYTTRIRGSPRLLASTALSMAFNTTRSTTKAFINLSKHRGLERSEAAALRDCVEQLGDSVDELKDSISAMSPPRRGDDFRSRMSDLQTWVSAALTNDDTCMGGFPRKAMKRDFKTVRRQVVKVAHLTSIALAFVNRYAAATH